MLLVCTWCREFFWLCYSEIKQEKGNKVIIVLGCKTKLK